MDKKIVAGMHWLADSIAYCRAGKSTNKESAVFALSTIIGVIFFFTTWALCTSVPFLGIMVLTLLSIAFFTIFVAAFGFLGLYIYQKHEFIFSREQIAISRKEKKDE